MSNARMGMRFVGWGRVFLDRNESDPNNIRKHRSIIWENLAKIDETQRTEILAADIDKINFNMFHFV